MMQHRAAVQQQQLAVLCCTVLCGAVIVLPLGERRMDYDTAASSDQPTAAAFCAVRRGAVRCGALWCCGCAVAGLRHSWLGGAVLAARVVL